MSRLRAALDEALDLHYRGENAKASALCDEILATVPNEPGATFLRGMIASHEGRHEEAVALMRKAIQRSPAMADYHVRLAQVYATLDRWEEAAASFRRVIRLKKDHVEALVGLGRALVKQKALAAALDHFRAAIAADPGSVLAHNELATTLTTLGRDDEALTAFRRVVDLVPDSAPAHINLAHCLWRLGDAEQALDGFEKAAAINPSSLAAHEALALHRMARAMMSLRQGRFAEGWDGLEWRWQTKDYVRKGGGFSGPMWDGVDVAGGTILLHSEQGLGDAIQFVRYAPLIADRGWRVFLSCFRPLARLFRRLPSVEKVLVHGEDAFPETDARAPLMSLPRIFGTTLVTIPALVPYLTVDPADADAWRARLASYPGRKVGLVWAGNPQYIYDSSRSMPVEFFRRLADVPDVTFFSLQFGEAAPAFVALSGDRFVDLSRDLGDFLNTAAIIANMDLVISTDTSVAHLAGALGGRVWTLLSTVADWRWFEEREDRPWYPTMRLFRQTETGDWAGVMARVRAELALLASSAATPASG